MSEEKADADNQKFKLPPKVIIFRSILLVAAVTLWASYQGYIFSGPPETVSDLSSNIQKTQEWPQLSEEPVLGVFFLQDATNSNKNFLFRTSRDISDISEEILEFWPDDYSEILWFIRFPSVDQYGNKGEGTAMKISYRLDDLKRINWDNMNEWQFLNLANLVEMNGGVGRKVAIAYCDDETHRKHSTGFCSQVVMHLAGLN